MIKQIIQEVQQEFGINTIPALLHNYGVELEEGEIAEDVIEAVVRTNLYQEFIQRVVQYEESIDMAQKQAVVTQKTERVVQAMEQRLAAEKQITQK